MPIVAILIASSNLYPINFAILDIAYFKYELKQKKYRSITDMLYIMNKSFQLHNYCCHDIEQI